MTSPTKRRKVSERYDVQIETPSKGLGGPPASSQRMANQTPSFSQVAQTVLWPSKANQNQEVTADLQKTKEKPKGRNAFHGSAGAETSSLSADVDLVASGVAIDATEDLFLEFLKGRGITAVKVDCLTKKELIDEKKVRTKTFKVTVKASEHVKAMNPEVWPYRVGVRYFRAPPRTRQGAGNGSWANQAAHAGGWVEEGQGNRRQSRKQHQNGAPSRGQDQGNVPVVANMLNQNQFAVLSEEFRNGP